MIFQIITHFTFLGPSMLTDFETHFETTFGDLYVCSFNKNFTFYTALILGCAPFPHLDFQCNMKLHLTNTEGKRCHIKKILYFQPNVIKKTKPRQPFSMFYQAWQPCSIISSLKCGSSLSLRNVNTQSSNLNLSVKTYGGKLILWTLGVRNDI